MVCIEIGSRDTALRVTLLLCRFRPAGTPISRHSTKVKCLYYFMDWSFKESQITRPDSNRDGINNDQSIINQYSKDTI